MWQYARVRDIKRLKGVGQKEESREKLGDQKGRRLTMGIESLIFEASRDIITDYSLGHYFFTTLVKNENVATIS